MASLIEQLDQLAAARTPGEWRIGKFDTIVVDPNPGHAALATPAYPLEQHVAAALDEASVEEGR